MMLGKVLLLFLCFLTFNIDNIDLQILLFILNSRNLEAARGNRDTGNTKLNEVLG